MAKTLKDVFNKYKDRKLLDGEEQFLDLHKVDDSIGLKDDFNSPEVEYAAMVIGGASAKELNDFRTKHMGNVQRQDYSRERITSEETEQVDELSVDTLTSYYNKARKNKEHTKDYQDHLNKSSTFHHQKSRDAKDGTEKIYNLEKADSYSKEAGKLNISLKKRDKGLKSAQKRLYNEETEQVDELSKGTLGSYVMKASHQSRQHKRDSENHHAEFKAWRAQERAHKNNPEEKEHAGVHKNKALVKSFTSGVKAAKRLNSISTAKSKMKNEEVENVDEILDTTKAKHSYVKKALYSITDKRKEHDAEMSMSDRAYASGNDAKSKEHAVKAAKAGKKYLGRSATITKVLGKLKEDVIVEEEKPATKALRAAIEKKAEASRKRRVADAEKSKTAEKAPEPKKAETKPAPKKESPAPKAAPKKTEEKKDSHIKTYTSADGKATSSVHHGENGSFVVKHDHGGKISTSNHKSEDDAHDHAENSVDKYDTSHKEAPAKKATGRKALRVDERRPEEKKETSAPKKETPKAKAEPKPAKEKVTSEVEKTYGESGRQAHVNKHSDGSYSVTKHFDSGLKRTSKHASKEEAHKAADAHASFTPKMKSTAKNIAAKSSSEPKKTEAKAAPKKEEPKKSEAKSEPKKEEKPEGLRKQANRLTPKVVTKRNVGQPPMSKTPQKGEPDKKPEEKKEASPRSKSHTATKSMGAVEKEPEKKTEAKPASKKTSVEGLRKAVQKTHAPANDNKKTETPAASNDNKKSSAPANDNKTSSSKPKSALGKAADSIHKSSILNKAKANQDRINHDMKSGKNPWTGKTHADHVKELQNTIKKHEKTIAGHEKTIAKHEATIEKHKAVNAKPGERKPSLLHKIFKAAFEETEINETLGPNATAKDWIDDFIGSTNPRFDGKSREERRKMAIAAYSSKKKKISEEIELNELSDSLKKRYADKAIKSREHHEKMAANFDDKGTDAHYKLGSKHPKTKMFNDMSKTHDRVAWKREKGLDRYFKSKFGVK